MLALALAGATSLAGGVLAAADSGPTARAAAALRLTQTTVDKRPVIDDANWTISESSARWDTAGFTGDYSWTLPSSVPAGGAQGAIKIVSTDKSGGRYNGVIGASGSIIQGGSARAEALADKNGGQASKTDSQTFKLVPDSCGSSCTVTVTVQDGPIVTFRYEPAESTKCASGRPTAFAALERVDLCTGERTTLRAPANEPVELLPEPMPQKATALEVFLALKELALEEEAEKLIASINLEARNAEEFDAFRGCLLLGDELLGTAVPQYFTVNERRLAVAQACVKLVRGEAKKGADDKKRVRSAANGCKAVFVPAFPKGTKVTKRKLRRARAAASSQIAASCSDRSGKLSISIRARNNKTLPAIVGRRVRVAVMHRAPDATSDGPARDLTARLRFRKG